MLPNPSRNFPMLAHAADGASGSSSTSSARSPQPDEEAEAKRQIGALLDQADRELAAGIGYELSEVQRRMRERLRDRER
jgi:hypothetical protein